MVWGVSSMMVHGDPAVPIIASASHDGSVYLKFPLAKNASKSASAHKDEVWAVELVKSYYTHWYEGRNVHIVSASLDGTVQLWDVEENGAPRHKQALHNSSFMVTALAADKQYVAAGDKSGTIKLWESTRLHAGSSTPVVLQADERPITALAFALPARREKLGYDGRWKQRLVAASDDGHVRVWDLRGLHPERGRRPEVSRAWQVYGGAALALAANDEGDVVSSGWDWHTDGIQQPWRLVRFHVDEPTPIGMSQPGALGKVLTLRFAPSGLLLAGGEGSAIRAVNATDWRVVAAFEAHSSPVHALNVVGEGAFVSGGNDRSVKLWHCVTASLKALRAGPKMDLDAVAAAAKAARDADVHGDWEWGCP